MTTNEMPKATSAPELKKKWYENPVYVILWLIFFFPVGIYGVWKYPTWSSRTKWILTALPIVFIVWSMISASLAAPTIKLSDSSSGKEVSGADYRVEGTVTPTSSTVKVNDYDTSVDSTGKFNYTITLKDGANEITIIATNAGKTTQAKQSVTKLTAEEAAKRKAEADAAAKVAADKAKAEADAKAKAEADAQAKANAPAEYKSALSQADSYANTMHLSKQGLYDQLVSEYGGKFTAAAAQYAIDNVKADWNANALNQAKSYQDTMHLSPAAVHDQLVSEYGGKFTQSEADYAIQHLND